MKTKAKKKLHPIFKDSILGETTDEDLSNMKSYNYEDIENCLPSKLEISIAYLIIMFSIILFLPIVIVYTLIMGLLNLFDNDSDFRGD